MKSYPVTSLATAAVFFLVFFNLAPAQTTINGVSIPAYIDDFWERDWDNLKSQISAFRNPGRVINATNQARSADTNAHIFQSDNDPLDIALRRTEALLAYTKTMSGAPDLKTQEQQLQSIKGKIPGGNHETLFKEVSLVRRQVALANPLLNFDKIIFSEYHQREEMEIIQQNNVCASYYSTGGGIFICEGWKTGNPVFKNILANSVFENGKYKGKTIRDIPNHRFNTLDLSYDGKKVVFDFGGGDNCSFHIYSVNTDGTGLRAVIESDIHLPWSANDDGVNIQLRPEEAQDFHPCWLPSGRIVFVSERAGGFVRCHGGGWIRQARSILFSIKPDGSDLVQLSWHETNELYPSVDNDGKIVYTRWDYVDRDYNAAHNIWLCNPDGTDPRAPHGNYPFPHYRTQKADAKNSPWNRPWAEQMIRAIPGSHKYIAVATSHHSVTASDLIFIDTWIEDDNNMSQVTRITNPDFFLVNETMWENGILKVLWFPGSWGLDRKGMHYYTSPWPLSEDFYLVSLNRSNDVLLLDKFGNRTVLFKRTGAPPYPRFARPLRATTPPHVLPTKTWQGEREGAPDHNMGVLSVLNVMEADFDWPPNTVISELRIIQIVGKPSFSCNKNFPRITRCDGAPARIVLGTVPVEDDGSAYFKAPVKKEIIFQALDKNGYAVQSIRSGTYVHPGEHLSCVGCHENKWKAIPPMSPRKAFMRPPSDIKPEAGGVEPVNYHRLVKPVLQKKCAACHRKEGKGPDYASMAYKDIAPLNVCYSGAEGHDGQQGEGYRSEAGNIGALSAGMGKTLLKANHQQYMSQGHFTPDDMRRIVLWLDCGAPEFGAYRDVDKQRAGELVWPFLDTDPKNPQGIEIDRPVPGSPLGIGGYKSGLLKEVSGKSIHFFRNALGWSVRFPFSGPHQVTLLSLDGRVIERRHGKGATEHLFGGAGLKQGIYALTVRHSGGCSSRLVFFLNP